MKQMTPDLMQAVTMLDIYALDHPAVVAWVRSLFEKQEPLGEPFSTILRDNLWDLYVRS